MYFRKKTIIYHYYFNLEKKQLKVLSIKGVKIKHPTVLFT